MVKSHPVDSPIIILSMKTLSLFSAVVILSISVHSAQAQGTSFGAGGSTSTVGATTPIGEKPKVLIPTERQFITNMCSAIQMQFKLAEIGGNRGRKDNDAQLLTISEGLGTELHATWDKLVALAQARGVESKYIPQEVSKRDQSQLTKLDKEKEEKWAVEFYELLLKETRSTSYAAETNTKMTKDLELKKIAEEMVAMYKYQTEQLEAARKAAKAVKPKKDKDKDKKW